MITVAILTDLCLYEQSLTAALRAYPDIDVVGSAGSERQLRLLMKQQHPDVMLIDHAMPGSISAIHRINSEYDCSRVVVISVPGTEHHIVESIEAGAAGYVARGGSLADLIAALRCASRGELDCKPRVAAMLSRRLVALSAGRDQGAHGASLTDREREIVELIDQGFSNKEISRRLNIRVATVKNHVHSLLEKLGVHRRGEAAALLHGRRAARRKDAGEQASEQLNPTI
jgi:DNA-binding NarL/FixJ family response regulator